MTPPDAMNVSRELKKAWLFLCTAHAAVTNFETQACSTEVFIQLDSGTNARMLRAKYKAQLQEERLELVMWRDRLLEAQIGVIRWAVTDVRGTPLPSEIENIIAKSL